jgi:hypothetical protein
MLPAASIDLDRAVIVPFLVPLLNIDPPEISTTVGQLVSTQASEKKQPVITGAKSDHRSDSEVQLERIEARLRTVQLALELLTAICAQLPESAPLTEEEEEEGTYLLKHAALFLISNLDFQRSGRRQTRRWWRIIRRLTGLLLTIGQKSRTITFRR